jgi:hypothetical protein
METGPSPCRSERPGRPGVEEVIAVAERDDERRPANADLETVRDLVYLFLVMWSLF